MKAIEPLDLVVRTKALVQEERRIGLLVLEHLREIERRKVFLELGFPSLFAFCVTELGYSEPQAQTRIDAMRAIRDTPAVGERLRAGKLHMTTVVKVQRFLRNEKRQGRNHDRLALFDRVQGMSSREVERELVRISPIQAQERERPISADMTEIRLVVPERLRARLRELQALYSHRMQTPGSLVELLELLTEDAFRKPERKTAPVAGKVSRHIPKAIERAVRERDRTCTFEANGRRCGSTYFLQVDHIRPFSRGGPSTMENLRLLCGAHNRLVWRKRPA
jgi:5-methylcytosine-specific restriction endonuclease McrA